MKNQVATQILANTSAAEEDTDRLLRINIMSLTDEMVKQLRKEIKESRDRLTYWSKTTPRDQFVGDLKAIS